MLAKSETRETLRPCSPSAKFVYSTLKRDGPLSYSELYHKTTLPKSTLSDALHELEEAGLIEPVSVFVPLSQREYQLS